MNDKVKYAKRVTGEDFSYELDKVKSQKRDFGATFMIMPELIKGIKRAKRRMKRKGADTEMYKAQVQAYETRLIKRYEFEYGKGFMK